jgi:hypothetical protein
MLNLTFRKSSVLLILMFNPNYVFAAYSNYNSILIGEQSAGLGGAYTAMYGDASGAPYYNPAGLAWMKGNSFSSSVSIYKKFDTVMGKDEDLLKAPLRVNQGFFQSIPSSAGSVIRWRDYNVGLSIVVPEYDTFKGDISTTGTNTATVSYLDESLWVGGTFAKTISKNETAGLTLYYTARNYNRTVQDRTIDSGANTAVLFNEEKNITGNSVVALLGYQIHWTSKFFLGATFRSPGIEVAGAGSYFKTEVTAAGGTLNIISNSKPEIRARTRVPGKVTLGLAYKEDKWLISADGSIYSAERYFDFTDSDIRSKVQHQVMFNGAIGAEYKFAPWLILRSGAFTNLTSHKELDIADKYGDRVDQLGWASNFTVISKEKIRFTFGGYYNIGRGKAIQRINQAYAIIPKTQQIFTMLVSTAYYF